MTLMSIGKNLITKRCSEFPKHSFKFRTKHQRNFFAMCTTTPLHTVSCYKAFVEMWSVGYWYMDNKLCTALRYVYGNSPSVSSRDVRHDAFIHDFALCENRYLLNPKKTSKGVHIFLYTHLV